MSDVIFPSGVPDGTPSSDDRILFSDTSNAGASKDCALSELPISDAMQSALDLKQSLSEKGVANGYASLNESGEIPPEQLPDSAGLGNMLKEVYDPDYREEQMAFLSDIGGAGGTTSPLYLTAIDSDIVGYKKSLYNPEETETILSTSVTDGEVLVATYLYDDAVDTTTLGPGLRDFEFYGYVSSAVGDTRIRVERFIREVGGTETTLFSITSPEINNLTGERISFTTIQPSFTVNTTDRLGFRVYISTTSTQSKTVYIYVGDGNASYVKSPIGDRHNNLRGRDATNAHPISSITGLQATLDGKVSISGTETITGAKTFSEQIITNAGSLSSPSIGIGDNDTGFFDNGTNAIGLTQGGVLGVDFQQQKTYFIGDDTGADHLYQLNIKGKTNGNYYLGIGFDTSNGYGVIQAHTVGSGSYNTPLILNKLGGNVGIGTSSPTSLLHNTGDTRLVGQINIGGGSNAYITENYGLNIHQGDSSTYKFRLYTDTRELFVVRGDGKINMANLPTSSSGLSSGDIWNNGGVINIVT